MGVTWNFAASARTTSGLIGGNATALTCPRVVATRATAMAALSAILAAAGAAVIVDRTTFGTAAPIGLGASPWFADAYSAPDGSPTLPDLASVEQVVNAPSAWAAGATGANVDVAVLDSGVTPVLGLHAPNKLVYGPDLSFDSQNPDAAYLDGYGHGTVMASIIAGNDGTAGGFQGVAPQSRVVS